MSTILFQHKDWPLVARKVRVGEIWYCPICRVRHWEGKVVFMHRKTQDEACASCVINEGALL